MYTGKDTPYLHKLADLKVRLLDTIVSQNKGSKIPRELQTLLEDLVTMLTNIELGEREWRDAFDAVHDPIFLHDKDYRITRANQAYAQQAGKKVQDVIGKLYWDVFPKGKGPLDQCLNLVERQATNGKSEEIKLESGESFLSRSFAVRNAQNHYLYSVHILEDVTRQRQLQVALSESAESYRTLFKGAPDAIFLADAESGQLIDANPAAERLTGRSREDLLSLHQSQLHPENSEAIQDFREHVQAGLEHANRPASEIPVLHADGHEIMTEITAGVFQLNGRTVIQGIFRDISARKSVEARLRYHAQVLAQIHDAVISTDLDGIVTSWNKGAEDLFGYTEAQVLGQPVTTFYNEAENRFIVEEIIAPLKAKGSHEIEVSMRHKSGEVFYAQLSLSLLCDEKDNIPVGMIGYALDITQRKLAERALQHSQAGLAEAQQLAHLGNWEYDIVNDHISWSDEIFRIFEIDPEQFEASYAASFAIIHPDDRDWVDRAYRYSVENKTPHDVTHRLLMPDGRIKYVREMCETHYDKKGMPLRSLGTVQDITEQYLTSQALKYSNHALKALSRCNSVLVHANSEADILNNMCKMIIEEAGYRFAWIGMVENDEKKCIQPVAHAGFEEGYLEKLNASYADDDALGRGPSGCAVREGQIQVVDDTLTDPNFVPWCEAAIHRGYRSCLSLPLKNENNAVFAVLSIYASEPNAFDASALKLMQELADDVAFGILSQRTRTERDHYLQEHLKSEVRYKQVFVDTIRAMSLTVEKRDPYTAGHQYKVAELSVAIGREMGMDEDCLEGLRLGATIHDIGKIYVPAEILNRPGRLSKAEFEIIKSHAEVGYDIIKDVRFPWPVADMVAQHHERMDGSGYPRGLKGEEIIPEARILAVADVVEAITSHRPYRAARGIDKAINEIETNRGTLYDKEVVDTCLHLIRDQGFIFDEKGKA